MKCNAFVRKEEVRRFSHRYIEFIKSPNRYALRSIMRSAGLFGYTFMIALPTVLTSWFRSFAAIEPTSSTQGRRKLLDVRVWLLNVKSVTLWNRSASTSRWDWIVCLTKCTWGYRMCLSLFWWICSTIGLPMEPFLVALTRVRLHC